MAQSVSAYVKEDVVPIATKLMVQDGYARRYLDDGGMRTYVRGLTQLGSALQLLPQDFVVSVGAGREKDVRAAVDDAVATLRPVYAKFPDAQVYLSRLNDLQNAVDVDEIGRAVAQQLQRTQH